MKKLILALMPFYLLPLFWHIATVLSTPIYTPVEDITLNCGSSGTSLNENDNRNWTGDINSKLSPTESHQANTNATSQPRETPPLTYASQIPYTTARLSRSEFTYKFPLTAGQKFVRFYFYPVSYGHEFDRSKAFFSVKAGGFTLLHDFNASVTADAYELETLRREFCLNIDEEQSLTITFTPSRAIPDAYAFVNGIEIVSMPTNLYYNASPGVAYVGNENNFLIENGTAMEMVYRLNIGGSTISLNQDTGMYRKWDSMVEEQDYLDDMSYGWTTLPQNLSIQLKFVKIPEYSAPKEVYQTGRSMGKNYTRNRGYKLTWEFPVDYNFNYLVRLHFCEFESAITMRGERTFVIYIANQTAEQGADIIQWSGGNGIPVYRDYVVFMSGLGRRESKVILSIALQTFPVDWLIKIADVLLNGLEIFKLMDSNGNLAGHNPDQPPSQKKHTKSGTPTLALIVAGVVSGILVLSVLGFLVLRRLSGSSHGTATESTNTRGSSLPSNYFCRYFSLVEIKAATQNFNHTLIIGVGGFGNVYRGCIDGGATPVAIKRLKPESSQGAHEFETEIEMLSQLRHRHLVSLIGYCTDKGEMILVYDYMARGTLGDHLHRSGNPPLSWEQRLQICIGAARGLRYLHNGARGSIIHRDVKSTNILLDEKWVAKVSDFGLSKMGTTTASKTHISTAVKGSFGYLDPEYYRRQKLTEKSDVYSFGVVLCEVLCGRPALLHTVEASQMSLAEWARRCHRDGELDQIIDPSMRGTIEAGCLDKFGEIAMSCIHDNGVERPSMDDVVKGLQFALQLHQNSNKNKGDNEAAFTGGSAGNTEQGCAGNESIQCISGTIFSEINDPDGR